MNGFRQQRHDDLRARVALTCAGYNLSPSVSEAVRAHGPHAMVRALTIPTQILDRADEVLAVAGECGLTALTPVSALWPWARTTLVSSAPLVLWARGQLEILAEPLIRLSEDPEATASAESEWAALAVATGLSDAGHVLMATTQAHRDLLVLRAAMAMGGRWVAVSTDLIRDTNLAPLGSSARGVVLSAIPPLHDPQRPSHGDAMELVSRLASATVDASRGWAVHGGKGSSFGTSQRALR